MKKIMKNTMKNTIKKNRKQKRRTMKGGMWEAVKGWWKNKNANVENNTNELVRRAQEGTLPKRFKNNVNTPKRKVMKRGANNGTNNLYGHFVDPNTTNNNNSNSNDKHYSPIPGDPILPGGRIFKPIGGKRVRRTRRTRRIRRHKH
jgi:hypothetical protein